MIFCIIGYIYYVVSFKGVFFIHFEIVLKLFLATLFGGLIGLEREFENRPAGFRTHTLVCMGSALVMLTSEYLFETYRELLSIDPGRLGAQVISGIGFLGAGTILKDGSRVRGLTTAASLWVVACIGLAIGSGFYFGALVASVFSYIILVLLKKVGSSLIDEPNTKEITILIKNEPGNIAEVTQLFNKLQVKIRDISARSKDLEWSEVVFFVSLPHRLSIDTLMAELSLLDCVKLL